MCGDLELVSCFSAQQRELSARAWGSQELLAKISFGITVAEWIKLQGEEIMHYLKTLSSKKRLNC